MTVTTGEAAAILGVSDAHVRMLVRRGKLEPLHRLPHPEPMQFWRTTVVEYEYAHRRDRESLTLLAERWRDTTAERCV